MITNEDTRERIIKELSLKGLPSEAQDEIISKLSENLLKKVAIAILDKLSEDKRGEFEILASTGDSDAMYTFLKANVSDADFLIEKEVQEGIAEIKQFK